MKVPRAPYKMTYKQYIKWRKNYLKGIVPAESVYKPNAEDYEVIGITGTTTYSFTGDFSSGVYAASGLTWIHPVGAEWTERADSARLGIRNDSGATRTVYGVRVWGTPVLRLSGKYGFISDDYVDYEDIARNGEQLVEIGNNYIISADQVNKVANWWWRYLRAKKHLYSISEPGFCSYYDVGEWYTLTITSTKAWNIEAVDVTAECVDVQTEIRAGDVGVTTAIFKEVYQNWVYDDSAITARYLGGVRPAKRSEGQIVRVAGQWYLGEAEYYCDGVTDQNEIQEAIGYLVNTGGGTVRCVGGIYNITSALTLYDNVNLQIDSGATISKNCNEPAISCVGSAADPVENISITGHGIVARDAADTNVQPLVYCNYASNLTIEGVTVDDSYSDGIYLVDCDTVSIGGGVKIMGCAGTGLKTMQSIIVIAAGISIGVCAIGCECWPSISDDVMGNGDCESVNEPMLDGETVPLLITCTWARSDEQAYAGTYSYKMVTTLSAGIAMFVDNMNANDLHGLTPGKSYLFGCKIYSVDATSFYAVYEISTDGGSFSGGQMMPDSQTTGAWHNIVKIINLPATATGVYIDIYIDGGIGVIAYVDQVHLYEWDETDSGFQLVNSSVSDCTDTGVSIVNNQAIIQNNQVTGCTNRGIEILAGYRNMITNNRAYNNGADTGIGNENQDNFYDAGFDTQVG